jgi:hypothetical protein
MILPTKHMKLSGSLLNVGAVLLKYLDNEQTITLLWDKTRSLPEIKSFEKFTLGLDFLFMVGAVDFRDGLLRRIVK